MTPQEIFLKASEIELVADRIAYLQEVCGDNTVLRDKVDALLATFESSDSPTAAMASGGETIDRRTKSPAEGQVGSMIGSYKLLQEIGEGGFGVVYMAEQVEPIRRKVALKIVKPGMDSKDVVARFEAERQALALMEHPNIAKVFDGGVTEFGRPYFVMELVKGIPITEFCDKNKLSTIERVKLCITVCMAIDHAHRKGIIHRDIKPSNVMVTLHDGKPVCKVIDFGVSKALTQQLTDKTLFTAFGQMVGTPTYMSPEQAEMSGLDIDIRSDIYSLGVVLYELLTGTTPLAQQEVKSATYDELQRMIKEEEAQRPSTRVSKLGEEATVNAKQRNTDCRKLTQQLSGDLDWIIIKALEKDRNRRYDSSKGLAEDLQRHINQEAVLARPPSVVYKTQKFLRRNRLRMGIVGVLVLVTTIVFSSGAIIFEGREQQAKLQEQADDLKQEKVALENQVKKESDAKEKVQLIELLVAEGKQVSAYELFLEIEKVLYEDPSFEALRGLVVDTSDGLSNQNDVTWEFRDWNDEEAEWITIKTDVNGQSVIPRGTVRVRATRDGYQKLEFANNLNSEQKPVWVRKHYAEENMVCIPDTEPVKFGTNKPLGSYWIDKYEVSNGEYAEFIAAGGYLQEELWGFEVKTLDDRKLEFSQITEEFVDATGQPGPSTWRNGTYPTGEEDFPVTGVSWYEAMAYAKFVGKELPTIYHWNFAKYGDSQVAGRFSNLATDGLAPRGRFKGIGAFGVYDMIGNASEWVFNAIVDSNQRCIAGAAWGDPIYISFSRTELHPFSRPQKTGFRCVKYIEAIPDSTKGPVSLNNRQFNTKTELTEEQFEVLVRVYDYDASKNLAPRLVSEDAQPKVPSFRQEIVEINAAYGGERFEIHLLFPRNGRKVNDAVIWCPGTGAMGRSEFEPFVNTMDAAYVREFVNAGYVAVVPILKGMYQRRDIDKQGRYAQRDMRVQMVKDIRRSIDYLQTRNDISMDTLTYSGLSYGAFMGVYVLTVEDRIKAGLLYGGGCIGGSPLPEVDPAVAAPFVTTPTLMVNGLYDPIFPHELSQKPLYDALGAHEKQIEVFESGHCPTPRLAIEFSKKWLRDKYQQQ